MVFIVDDVQKEIYQPQVNTVITDQNMSSTKMDADFWHSKHPL